MSELTLPDGARSNTVKQLDRRSRGNLECKYMLFMVQISMQMNTTGQQAPLLIGIANAVYPNRGFYCAGFDRVVSKKENDRCLVTVSVSE